MWFFPYAKDNNMNCKHEYEYEANCLDCCEAEKPAMVSVPADIAGPVYPWSKKKAKENKKESAMAMAPDINLEVNTTPDLDEQRCYLNARSWDIKCAKTEAAAKKFGMVDDEPPKTLTEFLDRIKSGLWTTDSEKDMTRRSWNPSSFILWRDPKREKDELGYEDAKALIAKDVQKIQDSIAIMYPPEALTELRAWEAAQ